MREVNIMNNNYWASYCNNTHTHGLTQRLYLYCTRPQWPTAIIHCFRRLIGNTKAAHAAANAHSVFSPQRSHQDTFKVSHHRGTRGTQPFNLHLSPSKLGDITLFSPINKVWATKHRSPLKTSECNWPQLIWLNINNNTTFFMLCFLESEPIIPLTPGAFRTDTIFLPLCKLTCRE